MANITKLTNHIHLTNDLSNILQIAMNFTWTLELVNE